MVSSGAGRVISVVKANYGRLDGKKCSRGRSRAQLGNVHDESKDEQSKADETKSVTCEGKTFLFCPQHFTSLVISVVKANYGRVDGNKCAGRRPRAQLRNIRCKNPAKKVAQKCNGKRRCNIKASNSVFGDPCRGTYKYLEVDFVCQGEKHAGL
uniref:SUEL-type lectin domain-containing protein n=1 Tax=Salarias fasciatus TaxID=181472 RepID=A0A672HBH0_SALFA